MDGYKYIDLTWGSAIVRPGYAWRVKLATRQWAMIYMNALRELRADGAARSEWMAWNSPGTSRTADNGRSEVVKCSTFFGRVRGRGERASAGHLFSITPHNLRLRSSALLEKGISAYAWASVRFLRCLCSRINRRSLALVHPDSTLLNTQNNTKKKKQFRVI